MIPKSLSHKVLSLGPDCVDPKGGIGMVLHTYRGIYEEFRFITTHKEGSGIAKAAIFVRALFALLPALCRKDIRIVHVHGASKGSFVRKSIIILLSKCFGKKVVYHIHGGGFKAFTQRHRKAVMLVLRRCDVIVALSDYWKSYFSDELHCGKVEIVHNIMPYPHERHSNRDDSLCTLLFLGKLCKEKGIYDLLEMLSKHIDEFRGHIRLLVAGIGETDKLKETIALRGLDEIVEFHGWVSGRQKEELLNASDVFVLPSYFEGVPISLLEAFSYHLPAISTNVGGIPEILSGGENGYLIAPGNESELYESVKRLASSPALRQQMGQEAYKRCLPHLPENVEKKLTTIYLELLSAGSSPPSSR